MRAHYRLRGWRGKSEFLSKTVHACDYAGFKFEAVYRLKSRVGRYGTDADDFGIVAVVVKNLISNLRVHGFLLSNASLYEFSLLNPRPTFSQFQNPHKTCAFFGLFSLH